MPGQTLRPAGSGRLIDGRPEILLNLYQVVASPGGVAELYSVSGGGGWAAGAEQFEGHFLGQITYSGTSLGPYTTCISGQHDLALRPTTWPASFILWQKY
jgi:hypothetical protein